MHCLKLEFIAALQNRQKLDSQFKENEIVFQELERAELESHQVYKMVGKILLRQENRDAIENVAKRIDFIKSEM